MRRAIVSLTPAQYHGLAYYEKWLQGVHDLLIEKDILGEEEIMLRCAAIREEMEKAR